MRGLEEVHRPEQWANESHSIAVRLIYGKLPPAMNAPRIQLSTNSLNRPVSGSLRC
jgi:hypothetical protein